MKPWEMRRRFGAGAAPGVGVDPYWSDVIACLNMPGVDGSTTFVDATGRAWAAVGDAQIDTSLGYNAGLFDGAGDYLFATTDSGVGVGSGAFTIEAWIEVPSVAGAMAIWDSLPIGGSGARSNALAFYINTGGTLNFFNSGVNFATGAAIPTNTLTHVCAQKSAGLGMALAVAGMNLAFADRTVNDTAGGFNVGVLADALGAPFNGYIKAVRVTKAARYGFASSFTPDAAPFPAS